MLGIVFCLELSLGFDFHGVNGAGEVHFNRGLAPVFKLLHPMDRFAINGAPFRWSICLCDNTQAMPSSTSFRLAHAIGLNSPWKARMMLSIWDTLLASPTTLLLLSLQVQWESLRKFVDGASPKVYGILIVIALEFVLDTATYDLLVATPWSTPYSSGLGARERAWGCV